MEVTNQDNEFQIGNMEINFFEENKHDFSYSAEENNPIDIAPSTYYNQILENALITPFGVKTQKNITYTKSENSIIRDITIVNNKKKETIIQLIEKSKSLESFPIEIQTNRKIKNKDEENKKKEQMDLKVIVSLQLAFKKFLTFRKICRLKEEKVNNHKNWIYISVEL